MKPTTEAARQEIAIGTVFGQLTTTSNVFRFGNVAAVLCDCACGEKNFRANLRRLQTRTDSACLKCRGRRIAAARVENRGKRNQNEAESAYDRMARLSKK